MQTKLKTLIWNDLFWPSVGGVEIFCESLILDLQKVGYEFSVITSTIKGSTEKENFKGITIFRLPLLEGITGNLKALEYSLKKIRQIKESFQPNLTHLNTIGPGFFYHLKTQNIAPHPTLFTLHFFPPPPKNKNNLLEKMFIASDWITAVSKTTLEEAIKNYPRITDKSSVIYNGLQQPFVNPAPLPWQTPTILSWGRLVKEKGFDLSLKAFALIQNKYNNLRYLIIGEGPERANLETLARELGITDKVKFLGYQTTEELSEKINEASFVVIPSRHLECFGLVALEAMQMERPVIASYSGGIVEVVLNNKTGLIVKREDIIGLSNAMDYFLSNPQIAETYGKAGKLRADRFFSQKMMGREYENLYLRLTHYNS